VAAVRPVPQERPAILVAYQPHPGDEKALYEICAGIEEEGVPYRRVKDKQERDSAAIAHAAASESRLLVGVGLDRERVCVHLAALPADAPLLSLDVRSSTPSSLRQIGQNAARLVSGMPLKGGSHASGVVATDARWRTKGGPPTARAPDTEPTL
jgi:Dehydratase medium subunit